MEAKMWNAQGWETIDNKTDSQLESEFSSMLNEAGFNVLNYVEHTFEPFGWTALWLLSESHFAIHTFPEENKYYWELSSCIEQKYVDFIRTKGDHDGV